MVRCSCWIIHIHVMQVSVMIICFFLAILGIFKCIFHCLLYSHAAKFDVMAFHTCHAIWWKFNFLCVCTFQLLWAASMQNQSLFLKYTWPNQFNSSFLEPIINHGKMAGKVTVNKCLLFLSLPCSPPSLSLFTLCNGWGIVGATLWAGRVVYLGIKSPIHYGSL